MTTLDTLLVELKAQTADFDRKFGAAAKIVSDFEKAARKADKVNGQLEKGAREAAKAADIQAKATAKAAREMEKAEKAAAALSQKNSLANWARTNATTMFSVLGIIRQVSGAVGALADAVVASARKQDAAKFFEGAGKSVEEYRKATHGLIADADLIAKANLADTMGISEEAFKSLANIAYASSLKTGQSFDYMFDSIVVGTARSSKLLLDNLGIIVSVDEANRKYAKSLKEGADGAKYHAFTVDQLAASLTKEGQQAAFANEVMVKGGPGLAEMAKLGEMATDKYTKLAVAWENAKDALAGFAEGVVGTLVPALQTALDVASGLVTALGMLPGDISVGMQSEARMYGAPEAGIGPQGTNQLKFMSEVVDAASSMSRILGRVVSETEVLSAVQRREI